MEKCTSCYGWNNACFNRKAEMKWINAARDVSRQCGCLILLVLAFSWSSCSPARDYEQPAELTGSWAEMTLRLTKGTPGNSPTYASRCLGYLGLAMYESVVHGTKDRRSLAGQLSSLSHLPTPDAGVEYDFRLALNASQAELLRSLYNHTSDANKASVDSLEAEIAAYFRKRTDAGVADRSISFGQRLAQAIFEWSKSDGGHRAYLKNFDKAMVHPDRPGGWKPPLFAQSFSHHPLHPHWGQNRPFLPGNYRMEAPEFIPYDTVPGSPYYEQFRAVYEAERALTQEQKEIAIWWGDDPDVTFTPPGHSYYLASMVVHARQPDLVTCAEAYARVGMAVADAFLLCWRWKYQFFSERPNTYVTAVIDEEWESFWPDPPFPAFPSGHAIQASAATTVLIDMFGDEFAFTDACHVGRPYDEEREVGFVARSFTRLSEVARETADSRFFGGIHTPQDNERGLEKGQEVGANVNGLAWKK
ncbi:vanadium-dependent haloperoxidase [Neolewinella lacunae]|nr:vanadium-dependent haloperoxidase [Neolewinella lacunae]